MTCRNGTLWALVALMLSACFAGGVLAESGPASQPKATGQEAAAAADALKVCNSCHKTWNLTTVDKLVTPGNPDQSRLYTVIRGGKHGKGKVMPAQIEAIRAWIAAGAPKQAASAPASKPLSAPTSGVGK